MNNITTNKYSGIGRIIDFVKDYTFGIYLIHWFVIKFITEFTGVNRYSLSYRLGGPVIVIAVCIALIWIGRKIPVIKQVIPK